MNAADDYIAFAIRKTKKITQNIQDITPGDTCGNN